MTRVYRRVLSHYRGSMNPYRWLLSLACGHEVWITCKVRPTRQMARCFACERSPASSE